MSASRIVWEAHGSLERDDCEPHVGRCWVCAAEMTRGQAVTKWNGASFTGQNKVRCPTETHVCEPCVFVCSRIAPVLGRPPKDGKSFGGNFRNYTSLWEQGWEGVPFGESPPVPSYANASKGDKPLIRDFLAREHGGSWFTAIADSGQKHVIPWAPVNPRGGSRAGLVLFDEELIRVPEDQSLIHNLTDLLTSGVTKDELARGEYRPRVMLDNREAIEHFEFHHRAERGSGWFCLAVWLAQRDETEHANQKRARDEARKPSGRVPSGRKKRVPADSKRKAPAVVLATAPSESAGSGAPVRHGERVGGERPTRDANPGPGQQTLPGLG